jgi:hypothetical protein
MEINLRFLRKKDCFSYLSAIKFEIYVRHVENDIILESLFKNKMKNVLHSRWRKSSLRQFFCSKRIPLQMGMGLGKRLGD